MLIAVHHNDSLAFGDVKAGAYGCRLAEVPSELDHFYSAVATLPRKRPLSGGITAAVVDQYQLCDNRDRVEDAKHFFNHGIDVFFFVIKRHHDAKLDLLVLV